MLVQIIYVSNRKTNCTEKEIEEILKACKKNNASLHLTGVLLYNEHKFLQLVEGEYKVTMEMYDKIKKDNRHENCILISSLFIKERSFPSWQMGLKKVDNSLEIISDISESEKKYFQQLIAGKQENDGSKAVQLIKKIFN